MKMLYDDQVLRLQNSLDSTTRAISELEMENVLLRRRLAALLSSSNHQVLESQWNEPFDPQTIKNTKKTRQNPVNESLTKNASKQLDLDSKSAVIWGSNDIYQNDTELMDTKKSTVDAEDQQSQKFSNININYSNAANLTYEEENTNDKAIGVDIMLPSPLTSNSKDINDIMNALGMSSNVDNSKLLPSKNFAEVATADTPNANNSNLINISNVEKRLKDLINNAINVNK